LTSRNNRLKFKTSGGLPRNLGNIPQIIVEKPKDVSMYPVGLANTSISTNYAQKYP
jgi:hypothetical protein